MTGVTEVGFSRSERLAKTAHKDTVAGTADGGGDCRGNDPKAARFAIVTYFKPSPAPAAAPAPAASTGVTP
jgi:hypothetical protein